jgi:hypothetical protein
MPKEIEWFDLDDIGETTKGLFVAAGSMFILGLGLKALGGILDG